MPLKFVLLFVTVFNISFAKTNIAIINLSSRGGISSDETTILTDRFRYNVQQTNKYKLLDRENMEDILNEQGFQLSGCTSTDCALEAGKLLNAKYIVTGSIGKLGNLFSIYVKIVDVESAAILKTVVKDFNGPKEGLLFTMESLANEICDINNMKTLTSFGNNSTNIYESNQTINESTLLIKKDFNRGIYLLYVGPNIDVCYIDGIRVSEFPHILDNEFSFDFLGHSKDNLYLKKIEIDHQVDRQVINLKSASFFVFKAFSNPRFFIKINDNRKLILPKKLFVQKGVLKFEIFDTRSLNLVERSIFNTNQFFMDDSSSIELTRISNEVQITKRK